ncbi:hypothetical protein [Halocatena marina]|uniref:hypothetical protein n=1 Tax=Halocatena marina TaxID=2934937 RepID=UPI00200C7613|nr:hypothetical protein [Halocatena marina]
MDSHITIERWQTGLSQPLRTLRSSGFTFLHNYETNDDSNIPTLVELDVITFDPGTKAIEYNAYTVTSSSDGWVQVYEPSSGDNGLNAVSRDSYDTIDRKLS